MENDNDLLSFKKSIDILNENITYLINTINNDMIIKEKIINLEKIYTEKIKIVEEENKKLKNIIDKK